MRLSFSDVVARSDNRQPSNSAAYHKREKAFDFSVPPPGKTKDKDFHSKAYTMPYEKRCTLSMLVNQKILFKYHSSIVTQLLFVL